MSRLTFAGRRTTEIHNIALDVHALSTHRSKRKSSSQWTGPSSCFTTVYRGDELWACAGSFLEPVKKEKRPLRPLVCCWASGAGASFFEFSLKPSEAATSKSRLVNVLATNRFTEKPRQALSTHLLLAFCPTLSRM